MEREEARTRGRVMPEGDAPQAGDGGDLERCRRGKSGKDGAEHEPEIMVPKALGITYTKSGGLALALATATGQNEIISARVRVRSDAVLTPRTRRN